MLLSFLLIIPLSGVFLIYSIANYSIKKDYLDLYRKFIALTAYTFNFIISLLVYFSFDFSSNQFQYVQNYSNTGFFEIYLGLDGISVYFVLLTTIIMPLALLSNWNSITVDITSYLIIMLLLETLLLSVFLVLDILLFYIFFESILPPLFLLIGLFGSKDKVRASYYIFLYTLWGSLFLLLSILVMSNTAGNTDLDALFKMNFLYFSQLFLFSGVFIAFAVKTPTIFLNNWLLKAHVESPLGGSIVLAAVVLKLSLYGIFRLMLPILPKISLNYTFIIYVIGVITVFYASFSTLRTTDVKELIAYSSVSHAAVYLIAVFSNVIQGIEGSILLGLGHGFVSSGLFICAGGVLYDRSGTRSIHFYRGMVQIMPLFSIFFFILSLGNCGAPLTLNFIGEFMSLYGVFERLPVLGVMASSSIIFSAAYTIYMFNRITFGGPLSKSFTENIKDTSPRELFLLVTLVFSTVILGIAPSIILDGLHFNVSSLIFGYHPPKVHNFVSLSLKSKFTIKGILKSLFTTILLIPIFYLVKTWYLRDAVDLHSLELFVTICPIIVLIKQLVITWVDHIFEFCLKQVTSFINLNIKYIKYGFNFCWNCISNCFTFCFKYIINSTIKSQPYIVLKAMLKAILSINNSPENNYMEIGSGEPTRYFTSNLTNIPNVLYADNNRPGGSSNNSGAGPSKSNSGAGSSNSNAGAGPSNSNSEAGPSNSNAEKGASNSDSEAGPGWGREIPNVPRYHFKTGPSIPMYGRGASEIFERLYRPDEYFAKLRARNSNSGAGASNSNAEAGPSNSNSEAGPSNSNAEKGASNSNSVAGPSNSNAVAGASNSNAVAGASNSNAEKGPSNSNSGARPSDVVKRSSKAGPSNSNSGARPSDVVKRSSEAGPSNSNSGARPSDVVKRSSEAGPSNPTTTGAQSLAPLKAAVGLPSLRSTGLLEQGRAGPSNPTTTATQSLPSLRSTGLLEQGRAETSTGIRRRWVPATTDVYPKINVNSEWGALNKYRHSVYSHTTKLGPDMNNTWAGVTKWSGESLSSGFNNIVPSDNLTRTVHDGADYSIADYAKALEKKDVNAKLLPIQTYKHIYVGPIDDFEPANLSTQDLSTRLVALDDRYWFFPNLSDAEKARVRSKYLQGAEVFNQRPEIDRTIARTAILRQTKWNTV